MKVSDYIVHFLVEKGITDVFGYPGGSVTNLMESFRKEENRIRAHVVYHEQAAAFAACSYAQTAGVPGVAYATGGPGATNLLTGIGHAFYDSIPVIFFTGNVNTYESKGNMKIRQKGFQESDNISIAKPLTKFCVYVKKPDEIRFCLEKAYAVATQGRPGPVLIDLPMDVQRAQVDVNALRGYMSDDEDVYDDKNAFLDTLATLLSSAVAPCIVLGNGVKATRLKDLAQKAVDNLRIPYVTSMIAFDVLGNNEHFNGFIGAYGKRAANFVVAKSDLIIAIGSRLDIRQVGAIRENFAPNANIIRVDIDREELKYKVHENEYSFCMNVKDALEVMTNIRVDRDYSHWLSVCKIIQEKLSEFDDRLPNEIIRRISSMTPENTIITTDVGQNQVWVAQSFDVKNGQEVFFSGGMGAMGHALPAAIGAYYGSDKKKVICICGDGGLQMNIQELQFLAREQLPIKIIVLNNNALGMIRHFQEMYFDKVYYQTNPSGGFTSPDFSKIADAYGLCQVAIERMEDMKSCRELLNNDFPVLVEIRIFEDTYTLPKLEYGKPNQDQQPLLDRKLYEQLMAL